MVLKVSWKLCHCSNKQSDASRLMERSLRWGAVLDSKGWKDETGKAVETKAFPFFPQAPSALLH